MVQLVNTSVRDCGLPMVQEEGGGGVRTIQAILRAVERIGQETYICHENPRSNTPWLWLHGKRGDFSGVSENTGALSLPHRHCRQ